MKTTILFLFCSLFAFSAFAQLHKGNVFVGATAGAEHNINSPTNTSTFLHINPSIGYAFSAKWMAGISAAGTREVTWSFVTNQMVNGSYFYDGRAAKTVHTVAIGPFVRYYTSLSPRFSFFAEGVGGYSYSKGRTNLLDSHKRQTDDSFIETSYETLYARASPGVVFFVTPKIGLELKMNFLSYTSGFGYNELYEPAYISPVETSKFKADFSLSNTSFGIGVYF